MKLTKKELLELNHMKDNDETREQGFTLLETCMALVIMMVVGLGAASLFFYSVTNNSSARDRQLSMAVAQQQMERLRNAPFANLNSTVTNTGGATKTVTNGGRQYRVATSIASNANGSLQTITVTATPAGGGATWATGNFGAVTLITQRAISTFGPNR
jgi:Tfp pilus assembly protein PilV